MSTVITNGYKLKRKLSLDELQNFSMELRNKMDETSIRICERLVAERIADILDTFMVRGESEIKNKYGEKRIDLTSSLFSEAYWDLWKEHQKFKKGEICSDPDANFDCKVVFFPAKYKLLAMFFCYHEEYEKEWESIESVCKYEYYNHTDRPKKLSKKQWDKRKEIWKQVLPGFGSPALNGMEVNCVIHMPTAQALRKEEILKYLPSFDKRVEAQAKALLLQEKWDEWNTKEENKDQIRLIMKIERWIRSEEGQAELEKQKEMVAKIVKPTIEVADLQQTIELFSNIIID
ncbi:hypothetical protein CVD28_03285 [Bacillus sp. M6-12]|uniref:hypothetical protein n=1 Tax=Bacillus sp. M6-12 TaxID=2054166 RepID=UPI000C792A65|nr:hypothetical protein [Bacillus sp. M6-12]PLS19453.1 hypothetical protein CVD28_03285 [Bacillus sp. M6-12]